MNSQHMQKGLQGSQTTESQGDGGCPTIATQKPDCMLAGQSLCFQDI